MSQRRYTRNAGHGEPSLRSFWVLNKRCAAVLLIQLLRFALEAQAHTTTRYLMLSSLRHWWTHINVSPISLVLVRRVELRVFRPRRTVVLGTLRAILISICAKLRPGTVKA